MRQISSLLTSTITILTLSLLFSCAERSDRSGPGVTASQSSFGNKSTTVEHADTAALNETSVKKKRDPIYDENIDGKVLIAAAIQRAKRDHKQVLIEWGGNWCGWCHRLHDTFTKIPVVKQIVDEDYVLVLIHIDSSENRDLLAQYTAGIQVQGYPHLTIVDSEGKVLTNQDTEPLEEGNGHSAKAVGDFLKQWKLPK